MQILVLGAGKKEKGRPCFCPWVVETRICLTKLQAYGSLQSVFVPQSRLTLCNAVNCSLPGSSVHRISQPGILEWVTIPFSRGSSQPGIEPGSHALQADEAISSVQFSHSVVSDFATLWTVACQALLSTGFSRQEYWNGLPSPPPGDLPDPGIEPASISLLHWRADSLPQEPPGKPRIL